MLRIFLLLSIFCIPSLFADTNSTKIIDNSNNSNIDRPQPQAVYISEVIDDGMFIMLSDNSVWLINPDDRAISGGWISPGQISLQHSNNPSYPYYLNNHLTNDRVLAKKTTIAEVHAINKASKAEETIKKQNLLQEKKLNQKAKKTGP